MARPPLTRSFARLRGADAGPEPSDGELLRRFADERDETAFADLVRRHGGMVWGVCRRVGGDPDAADDAFQATFLVLVRKAGAVANRESVSCWLHGVARRVAARARDRNRRETPSEVDPVARPRDPEPDAHDIRAVLDEELGRLPEKYRAPLVLCYLDGKTNDEAAAALGWTRGTVAGRMARARDLLRGRLARRGFAPSAVALVVSPAVTPAVVPAAVLDDTIRNALAFAAGAPVASAAVPLAEGVLRSMRTAKLSFVAAVVLAAGAIAGALFARPPEPPTAPVAAPTPVASEPARWSAGVEKFVPTDTAAVVTVDVRRLIASAPFAKHIRKPAEQLAGGKVVAPYLKLAGIDPFRDITRVTAVSAPSLFRQGSASRIRDRAWFLVIVGRFDADKLRAAAAKLAADTDGKEHKVGGKAVSEFRVPVATAEGVPQHYESRFVAVPDAATVVFTAYLDFAEEAVRAGNRKDAIVSKDARALFDLLDDKPAIGWAFTGRWGIDLNLVFGPNGIDPNQILIPLSKRGLVSAVGGLTVGDKFAAKMTFELADAAKAKSTRKAVGEVPDAALAELAKLNNDRKNLDSLIETVKSAKIDGAGTSVTLAGELDGLALLEVILMYAKSLFG